MSIRLALYTESGPVGPRLERGAALPVRVWDFDCSEEGRVAAEGARVALQEYCDRHHGVKMKTRRGGS